MKDEYVQKTNLVIDVNDESNLLADYELYLGAGVIGAINKLHSQNGIFSPKQIDELTGEFKKRCRKFYNLLACRFKDGNIIYLFTLLYLLMYMFKYVTRYDFADPIFEKICAFEPKNALNSTTRTYIQQSRQY